MAKKRRRISRPEKKSAGKITGRSGRGSARMSGRKPKSAVKKAGAGPAGSGEIARALEALNWSHAFMDRLVAGVPADRLTWQSAPSENHVLWTLGHLATSYVWFASMLGGEKHELPVEFEKSFGYKSAPVSDPGQYPAIETVRRHYDASYRKLAEAVGKLREADAHSPTIGDAGDFARTKLEVVWRAIWHDGWHQGQISSLRRSMGLPGVM